MIVGKVVNKLLDGKSSDDVVVCNKEDYYNGNPQFTEIIDIAIENGKVILITD